MSRTQPTPSDTETALALVTSIVIALHQQPDLPKEQIRDVIASCYDSLVELLGLPYVVSVYNTARDAAKGRKP